jgi:hypothetical protein
MGDPVVQTSPMPVTPITVGNESDNLLASRYPTLPRPTRIVDYGQYSLAVDTISAQKLLGHEFTWKPTDSKIVMVAIFQNVITVGNNEIANRYDLVWLWTNPDGTTDPGRTKYADGRAVTNWDKVTDEYSFSSPILLTASKTKQPNYVWCVLAWDKQGYAIRYASRELPLSIR